MFSGQTLTIKVRATDPVTQLVVRDATGTAYLFGPPKDPVTTPGDRTPDATVPLAFDAESNYYLGTWDSTGAAGGTWWCQGRVTGGSGGYDSWDYQDFPLSA
jgi:hypothetical protein